MQQLLGNPPSHEATRSELQLAVANDDIKAVRELEVGDQARFLEIVDRVSTTTKDSNLWWPRR